MGSSTGVEARAGRSVTTLPLRGSVSHVRAEREVLKLSACPRSA
jgi:hypothetical protein